MHKAKKLMKKNLITAKSHTPIYQAIKLMAEHKITGLPVVNDDMTLAGIVTEKDVLRFVADLGTLDLLADLKESTATIDDFMTTDVTSFDENENLIVICRSLIENNFGRVPILSKGKLVGIISRKDLIRYILKPIA